MTKRAYGSVGVAVNVDWTFSVAATPGSVGADWASIAADGTVLRTGPLELNSPNWRTYCNRGPSPDVRLVHADVPGSSLRQALQAVPYAVEDSLAEELVDLRLAVGERSNNGFLSRCTGG